MPSSRAVSLPVLAAVAVTVLAWASAFIGIRAVGSDVSPGALALGRLLVGTAVLALLSLGRGWVAPTRQEWRLLVLCGVGWFAVYNVALNAAEQHLDAGTTAMLVNTGPVLIAVLAGVWLGEGFPRWLVAGLAVAFGGVLLIGVATGGGGGDLTGVLLCLVAAVTYAVGVVAQKPVLRRIPPLQVTLTACAIGAVCCLPWTGALVSDLAAAPASSVLGLVYLGVVPTALAFSTWAYALARTDAGRLGVTTYLVPPLVIAMSWLLLDEVPPALAVVGGVVCLAGVALSRRRSRVRRPVPVAQGAGAA
ncbi:Threonine/homoserine efflux transporter RhtA [Geodermatophilus obscurus]|jgi:drug/metabolite transporter (DMT)-like permease|uniref:Threonine/homoserine efflux transporter RhtA n=1 Tax=Geodermatophilus obscurus TaxID=1861 RepID=A0A1I5HY12_9ACTN|nr:DMT family transporter [Geodermatophilus obscurus]SFO53157.1 Threonine/homoserine efflux transporter RhtA [Geodermatophilus obscurus]